MECPHNSLARGALSSTAMQQAKGAREGATRDKVQAEQC